MSFGWSVGDIVASITLIAKISVALKDSGGAKSDYQESIEFLFGLEVTLQNLRTIAPVLLSSSQEGILQVEIEKVVKPVSAFFDRVQKLDGSLGKESKKSSWRTAPQKVQWAIQVSKEVNALRDSISVPIAGLNILLQSQVLLAISTLQEKLPCEIADRLASRLDQSTSISSNLRDEIVSLKASVKAYEVAQKSMNRDIMCAIEREKKISSAPRSQFERLPRNLTQELKHQTLEGSFDKSEWKAEAKSKFEQKMVEQSRDNRDLKIIYGSIHTMVDCRKDSLSHSSTDLAPSSQAIFQELKTTFCKCVCLLALSIQQLFKEAMILFGPQFVVFLLVFKQLGIQAPRLLLGDRFLFEDVLGRQKYLPIEFFQHYTVFSSFLQESFAGLPGQRYVKERQFQLTDGKNGVVSSQLWQQTVIQRSKIAMTVVLDAVEDELIDGLACPRCSTLETFAKPDMSIECSSCKMQYRTTTFQKENVHRDSDSEILKSTPQFIPMESTPSESSTQMETKFNVDNKNGNVGDNLKAFGEVRTVTVNSTALDGEVTASETRQESTWKLPWDEEELKHFKRVKILKFDSQKRMSSASTLALISAAVKSLVAKFSMASSARSRSKIPDLGIFMSELIDFSNELLEISNSAYTKVLTMQEPYIDPDWTVRRSSTARQRLEDLVLQSRTIFKEIMVFYHEWSNHAESYDSIIKKTSSRRSFVLEQTDRSKNLGRLLLDLSQIDDSWRSGGSVTSIEIGLGIPRSLEVTQKYIALSLYTSILIFDHNCQLVQRVNDHFSNILFVVIHEDYLIFSGSKANIYVWDIKTGRLIRRMSGHLDAIRCLELTASNHHTGLPVVVSGSSDSTLRIWDCSTGLCTNVLVGHTAIIGCLATVGDLVASGSNDTTVRIWSISKGCCLRTLAGHETLLTSIAMDRKRLCTGSFDHSIRVWDVRTGVCQAILKGQSYLLRHLRLRNDKLISSGRDGDVLMWSLENMTQSYRVRAAMSGNIGLEFNHSRVMTGTLDGRIHIWDTSTFELIRVLGKPAESIWQMSMSETMAVVVCSRNGKSSLEVWSFSGENSSF